MKKSILIFVFSLNVLLLVAQKPPAIQIHAYYRETLPGAAPNEVIDETGKAVVRAEERQVTYFIYFIQPAGYKIKPAAVWLEGKAHKFSLDTIKSTPIILHNSSINAGKAGDTLIKKTTRKVLQILPQTDVDIKPSTAIAQKMKTNQLIIEYFYNGKKYYSTIKQIKRLPSLALQ